MFNCIFQCESRREHRLFGEINLKTYNGHNFHKREKELTQRDRDREKARAKKIGNKGEKIENFTTTKLKKKMEEKETKDGREEEEENELRKEKTKNGWNILNGNEHITYPRSRASSAVCVGADGILIFCAFPVIRSRSL